MKRKAIVVSHTHWDREWYLPFQEYRLRLIRALDKAIDVLLNDSRFKSFMLDGQTCILEDYLELKPEKEPIIKKLVSESRLLIGPLYTQPDEALASSEALIRNFLIGIRTAQSFGGVMKIGYLPDTFGHTPQLPQILKGFNIDIFFFTRGLGDEEDELGTEFLWEAPDGSRVLTVYFAKGYCNANMLGVENPYMGNVWRAPDGWYTIFFEMYFSEKEPDLEKAKEKTLELAEYLLPRTPSGVLLLMNGCDHQPPQAKITEILKFLNSSSLKIEFEHGALEDYVKLAKPHVGKLKIHKGELRGAKTHPILAGVLSTRAYLKQLNYRAQLLLEKYAEPLSALAMLEGMDYPTKPLLLAWKLVLQNQAHDSIYGSGSDPVHVDNESRFLQAISIASNIAYESARYIAEQHSGGEGLSVLVYNPSSWSRTDVVLVALPAEEAAEGLIAVDDKGSKSPLQIIGEEVFGKKIKLAVFLAREVPPLGYKVYRLEKGGVSERRNSGSLHTIENEYFRVEADPEKGGVLKIVDKESGVVYEGLNVFVDEGDAGDEYNYSPPKERDLIVESTSFKAEVEKEEGPVASVLRIKLEMEIPEKLEGQSRSEKTVKVPVVSEVFLYKGVNRIDIRTMVDNKAMDHRFRVKFPLGIISDKVAADSHFYVIERSVKQEKKENWIEVVMTHPQLYWVDVSDGEKGVTIANKGIPEYETREEEGGVALYLTLFRSIGWLSRDDLQTRKGRAGPPIPTPGAQCLRKMTFEYSIIPHRGTWLSSKSYRIAREFAEPLMAVPLYSLKATSRMGVGVEPAELIVTAFKKAEDNDALILRFYNIAGEEVEGVVKLGFKVKEVWRANLNEEPLEKIGEGDIIKVKAKPHKVYTLLLKP